MSRKMLVNATHPEENRVAIVEDGVLSVLDIEVAGQEQTKGNIYQAVVVRVEPGLQAAFVDYGGGRLGFLQIDDVHGSFFRAAEEKNENKSRPRINDLLHRGQEIIVQIVKEERGTKGAALTTYLSLAGRYMVLMPDSRTKTLSRKIEASSKRKKLKEDMDSFELPEDMGYIVRTAALDQTSTELERDCTYLLRIYEQIQASAKKRKAPALIYRESNLVLRSIREHFTLDTDEVLVDDPKVFQEAKDFFQEIMPEYAQLVKLHQERRPVFSRYQIEAQIDAISTNRVPLPSGGSLVIDQTEALVAIDVNSGKMTGEHGVEATALRTNTEAAEEVARQLRLRDLGGLIVIDFIDMRENKNNRSVEKTLKQALKPDKAKISVGRISQFGLLEMSRQRMKQTLIEATLLSCPHCNGSGSIKSVETRAIALLRSIHAGIAKGQVGRVNVEAPADVVSYLLNTKRGELAELENKHQAEIHVNARNDFFEGQDDIQLHKRQKEEKKDSGTENGEESSSSIETTADELPKAKRSRRRRGGRGTKPNGEISTPETDSQLPEQESVNSTEASEPQPDVTNSEPTEATPDTEQTETAKPKRRRSRRRRSSSRKAEESQATSPADQEESSTAQVDTATASESESATPVEEKKPRRRRSANKTEQDLAASASDQSETISAQVNETTDAKVDVPAEEKKPRQRRTTKTTEPPTTAAKSEATLVTDDNVSKDEPTKKTRRGRTPQTKDTSETPVTATPQAGTTDNATTEHPEKKTTRRKRTTKAKEAATESSDAVEKVTDNMENSKAEEPASKPRRPRKLAATPANERSTKVPSSDVKETTAKATTPKRKTNKPPTDGKLPSVPMSNEENSETKPKATRRRKTVKKTDTTEKSAQEKSPEDTPASTPKKRAPRKSAASKAKETASEPEKKAEADQEARPKRRGRPKKVVESSPDAPSSDES